MLITYSMIRKKEVISVSKPKIIWSPVVLDKVTNYEQRPAKDGSRRF